MAFRDIFRKEPETEVQPEQKFPIAEEQPVADPNAGTDLVNSYVDEMGVVAPDTVIHGGITTKGHLAVAGRVDGDLEAAGNIILTGVVKGDIHCNNIMLEDCQLYSVNIYATGSVSIKEGASLSGDISCKHLSLMGTFVGNINASGNVALGKSSVTNGDVSAAALAVEPGAKIKGNIDIR